MPAPFPTLDVSPDLRPMCACITLLSNADHACAALFSMRHASWPAPNCPSSYGPSDMFDAAQGALCGLVLHMGNQLRLLPGVEVSPSWRSDDWMDEARCVSQSLHGRSIAFPQAFIHLSSGGAPDVWTSARSRFLELSEALMGPATRVLDSEKAYRSENFWTSIRQNALSIDEASRLLAACTDPAEVSRGSKRL